MHSATAPAKLILLGEHAVVYGQPAIAVPVSSLRAEATIDTTGQPFQIIARDFDNRTLHLNDDDPLAVAARLTLEHIEAETPEATLTVQSGIPPASGLGSGAAVSAAIVRVLAAFFGVTLSSETINRIVYEVEKLHHGTPSGIDNTTVVYEQPVYFVKGQAPQPMTIREPVHLVVADTGKAALTKLAVADVRQLYTQQPDITKPLIERIGDLTDQARTALKTADFSTLGQFMTENHYLLRQLTVSSPELDNLVQVAVEHGAAGAKLSGGGRGGNMIALVTSETRETVMQALRQAGATHVFSTTVDPG
jgi:mevalonate kinase